MNNTRIRYSKNGATLISRRIFATLDGKAYRIFLDTESMKYSINDVNGIAEGVDGGKTKNLAVLKIQAKEALMSLGVNFESENRNRGNNISSDTSEQQDSQ